MTTTLFSRIIRAWLILACLLFSLNLMAQAAPPSTSCSNATLNGTYPFLDQGNFVGARGALTPVQFTGFEVFDGNGNAHGFYTEVTVVNGQTAVSSDISFTATYTVNANCTVKEVARDANNNVFHFDEFIGPDGNHMTVCVTDPGTVVCGAKNRDSGQPQL
jgi:hypothetical protein